MPTQAFPPATGPIRTGDEIDAALELLGPAPTALDCGCSYGRAASKLQQRGSSVTGIELIPELGQRAQPHLCELILGDLQAPETWDRLADRRFDAVLFIHVLEHLTQAPWVLQQARERLAPHGAMLVVLPNVSVWHMRLHLLNGRFDYDSEGIRDTTHVRFYTYQTACRLLHDAGLVIEKTSLFAAPLPTNPIKKLIIRTAFAARRMAFVHSMMFRARPAT